MLFLWLLFPLVGAIIGQRKGATFAGLLYGLLLGPLGLLVILLLRGDAKRCPQCGEQVRPEAQVCRYCHADLSRIGAKEGNLTAGGAVSRFFLYFVFPLVAFVGLAAFNWHRLVAQAQSSQPATMVTPTPTPMVPLRSTPLPPAFVADVNYSQRAAVARYPELGKKDSPLNARFLARLDEWKVRGDQRLSRSDWPEKLAADCYEHP